MKTDAPEPGWMVLARKEIGVKEAPGDDDSKTVLSYYADAGHPEVKRDETAWCAAFVGAMLKRSGIAPSGSLLAKSYLEWGSSLEKPKAGCVVVLQRGEPSSWTGHVGFFVSENGGLVSVLGGNQGDSVKISRYPVERIIGFRWPKECRSTKGVDGMFSELLPLIKKIAPTVAGALIGPKGGAVVEILAKVLSVPADDKDVVNKLQSLPTSDAAKALEEAEFQVKNVLKKEPSPNGVLVDPQASLVKTLVSALLFVIASYFVKDAAMAQTLSDALAPAVAGLISAAGGGAVTWLLHRSIGNSNANTVRALE